MSGAVGTRTAAEVLVDGLVAQGVTHVFCIPGESYLAVLDAFVDRAITVIVCRQEAGAAIMAEAWGKATGRPGVCFVTRGPGATNAMHGIHIAQQASSPMILFVGQVARGVRGREAFQELDYPAVFGSMTKWTDEVRDAQRIPELLARAFATAMNGRPGPIVLSLPEDMLSERLVVADAPRVEPAEAAPTAADLSRLRALLEGARAPMAILGGSRWTPSTCDAIRRFAERWALPVATSFRRLPLFDALHETYAGDLGIGANPKLLTRIESADLLLVLGGRLGDIPSQGYTLLDIPDPACRLVHVHPEPGELGRVYAADLAIAATPAGLLEGLETLSPATPPVWTGSAAAAHAEYLTWSETPTPQPGGVNLGEIVVWLREQLPPDAVIANGAGNFAAWVGRFMRIRRLGGPCRTDVGVDGLRRARRHRHAASPPWCSGGLLHRRRRFPDERARVRHRLPIRAADRGDRLRQRALRHDPHAPGARISGPADGDGAAKPRLRRLCPRLRRLRRHGHGDRGVSRRLRGGARKRPSGDPAPEDRPRGDPAWDDAQ